MDVHGALRMSDTQSIIRDLLRRAGFSEKTVDASGINGYVRGLGIGKRGTIRAAVDDLLSLFQIDAVESDGVLKFTFRGKTPVVTLSSSDLVPISEDPQQLVSLSRKEWFSLPSRLDLVYPDINNDHENSTESGERQVVSTTNYSNIQTSIVLDGTTAKQIADALLDTIYVETFTLSFNTFLKYGYLEVGDVVGITIFNRTWNVRISKLKTTGNLIEIEGVTTDIGTYEQKQSTGTTPPSVIIVTVAKTNTLLTLDIPLVDDTNDVPGYFIGVAKDPTDTNFRYSDVYTSSNNTSFALADTLNIVATSGLTNTVLPTGPTGIFLDKSSSVTVTLTNGTLESITYEDLLNGGNGCVIGNELLQFQTATLIGAGIYTLTNLLRGRRGTEWAMSTHSIGERFVLSGSAIFTRDISQSSINVIEYLKSVSNGQFLSDVSSISFTPQNIRQKPFSPVKITSSRDLSGNVTISWKRRTRIGGEWQNNVEASIGETSESYQIDIFSGITNVRTLSSSTNQVVYTATEQTQDFGSIQSSIVIKVYQMSSVVGRGYSGDATV
jgi:hypothetical protein